MLFVSRKLPAVEILFGGGKREAKKKKRMTLSKVKLLIHSQSERLGGPLGRSD